MAKQGGINEDQAIMVRVHKDTRDLIQQAANKEHLPMGSYLHLVLNGKLPLPVSKQNDQA